MLRTLQYTYMTEVRLPIWEKLLAVKTEGLEAATKVRITAETGAEVVPDFMKKLIDRVHPPLSENMIENWRKSCQIIKTSLTPAYSWLTPDYFRLLLHLFSLAPAYSRILPTTPALTLTCWSRLLPLTPALTPVYSRLTPDFSRLLPHLLSLTPTCSKIFSMKAEIDRIALKLIVMVVSQKTWYNHQHF